MPTAAPSPKPTPTPSPAPQIKQQSKSSETQFLPLAGGKVSGKVTFAKTIDFLDGFKVGSDTLLVNASGALSTNQPIKVGGVEIIGKDGKIATLTSSYFGSLDGSALTGVNALKLDSLTAGALLRSDEGDTAEGAIKFTAKPTGSGVANGSIYINPASASANDTLLGVAVNGTSKFKVDAEGDIVIAGDVQLSDDLTSSATTFNLLNSTVETLNLAGAATTVNLADSTTTKTIDIGGVTASGADTVNIATHRTNADTIEIGNDNASTTTAITGGDDWKITGTGILTLSASADQTTALDITDSNYTNALSIADNLILGTTASIDLTNFDVTGSSGDITTGGDIAVNGGDLTTTAATFNLVDAATTVNLGATAVTRTINIGTGTNADTLNIGTGATTANTVNIATGAVANTIAIGSSASTTVSVTDDNWSITAAGLITTADDAAINGGDLTTTAATFNLVDAATTVNLGATAVTRTINIGTGTNADTLNIGTGATTADAINIGTTDTVAHVIRIGDQTGASSSDTAITDAEWSITTAGLITTADDAAINGGDLTTTAATFNLANAATTLALGSTAVTRTINLGTGTNADTINIGTGATTADAINIGTTDTVAHVIRIGDQTGASSSDTAITDAEWSITTAGAGTLVSLNLGGTTILDVLSSTTANVVAANVPTIACATYATLTLTGAVAGDAAIATPTAVAGGIETLNLIWSAYATTDAVVIRACNPTAAGIDAADTQTWRAEVIRH